MPDRSAWQMSRSVAIVGCRRSSATRITTCLSLPGDCCGRQLFQRRGACGGSGRRRGRRSLAGGDSRRADLHVAEVPAGAGRSRLGHRDAPPREHKAAAGRQQLRDATARPARPGPPAGEASDPSRNRRDRYDVSRTVRTGGLLYRQEDSVLPPAEYDRSEWP